jgi:Mg/Co/Ni transporter MgtE
MEEPNTQTTETKVIAPRPKITTARLKSLIAKKDGKSIQKLFVKIPDIDIAEAANTLEPTELIFIFRCVEKQIHRGLF